MAFDAGSVIAKLKADLSDFQAGLNKAKEVGQSMADRIKGGVESMNGKIKEMTPELRKGALVLSGIAAAGTLMLNDWKGAAMGAEVEMARFEATLAAIGNVSVETKDKLLAAAGAAVKLGFDDEETANVLANFYQRTKDVNSALTLNQTAMDLARKKNIGLSEAANLVTQVLSGNGRVLKQYGIDIKESASPLEALAQLQEVVQGQSAAYMETATGKSEALAFQIGNLKENLGAALLPIMNMFTDALARVVEWLNNLSPGMQKTIAYVVLGVTAFAAIAAPVLGFITLIPLLTAGIGTLVTVLGFLFSPIGLLVAAIAALAAAWSMNLFGIQEKTQIFFQMISDLVALFKFAWENDWYYIRSIVEGVFTFFVEFFTLQWEAIKLIFTVATALLRGDWQTAWDAIKNFAKLAFDTINGWAQAFWDGLKAIFDTGIGLLQGAWSSFMNGIKSLAESIWDGIKSAFKAGINELIGLLNGIINSYNSVIGRVPGKAGRSLQISNIPLLAEGGIVNAPTLAMIGEGNEPEAVIPLSKLGSVGGGIHIHLHDSIISSVEAATELLDAAVSRVKPRLGV